MAITAAAKKYCPNPKDPTEGLRKRSDGIWERIETIDKKRKSFSSKSPVEVWKKRAEFIAKSTEEKESLAEETEHGPLFEEVADKYEAEVLERKSGTQRAYLPAIKRARERFSGRRMNDIAPWEIKAFLTDLSGFAHTTVSNQKTVINAIYQLYIDDPKWHGDYNPAKMTTMPRQLKRGRREPPKNAQIEIVKNSVDDPEAIPAIIYLCTGERRGESCGIQLKDIDFEHNIISINKAVEWISNQPHITVTKTEAGIRKVPLLSLLKTALDPYRDMPPSTYIIGMSDKPVTASWYARHWAAFWRKHGYAREVVRECRRTRGGKEYTYRQTDWVAEVCAHQFRHEYVCMLAEAEVPEEIAMQLVGHANQKMIHDVYMHLKPSMIKGAAERLNKMLK